MAIGAAAFFIAATVVQTNEAKKREKRTIQAQEKAGKVEAAVRANEARRSRRDQIRELRRRQGQVENIAAGSGQTESSAAIAGTSSLQADFGVNLGTINSILSEGNAKTVAQQDIFNANRKSGMEVISGLGAQISGAFVGKG